MRSDRYDEILHAAMDLFSDKGYSGTSMRDIADAVGLQPGSLYAHISGKEDLLSGIVDWASEQFMAAVTVALEDSSLSAAERLSRFVEAHVRIVAENKAAVTVFLHEWGTLEGERGAQVRGLRDDYQRLLIELLDEGVQRGEFRPLDTEFAAVVVLSLVNWTHTWVSPCLKLSVEMVASEFTDLLVTGVHTRATDRPSRGTRRVPETRGRQLRETSP